MMTEWVFERVWKIKAIHMREGTAAHSIFLTLGNSYFTLNQVVYAEPCYSLDSDTQRSWLVI